MTKRWLLALNVLGLAISGACTDPIETEIAVIGTPRVNQNFTLAVKVKSATPGEDVYGNCFDVMYDTAKMTFASLVQINQDPASDFTFSYETHNYRNGDPGRLVVCVSKEGQVAGDTGDGEVVRVRFLGKLAGTATVSFADQYMVRSDGSQATLTMPSYNVSIAN